ncbi:glycerate kinase type-2 family protein [Roseovarius salinarum]|uniref:glycerate kinase type-2 family protein n=1 Tax=Roseovarius salinarum TaxID=1981892 RepID=UPI001E34A4EE|nr:glycerate kinase [Roseovarius salinarum]
MADPAAFLRSLFDRAVAVADPMRTLHHFLPPPPAGRLVVVGAGKASARMAEAVEAHYGPCEGLVITRYGYGRPCTGIEIVEAAHPVPDAAGRDATARMLDMLTGLDEGDLVLALISGGASALLVQPAGEITLDDKMAINAALLASGAPIGEMNTVRKHLSRVKGGQLAAAAHPARVLALLISDVPGDDPGMIGSGPTVGDTSTPAEARAILDRHGIDVPASARAVLSGKTGVVSPDDPRLARAEALVYAAPSQSLGAASALARDAGCRVQIMGDALEGEAREVAGADAARARAAWKDMAAGQPPLLLLSGGELTVTRRGDGCGGPNAEYALALAVALQGAPGIHALACDTDGVDGAAEVAGAIIGPDTEARAKKVGRDPATALADNDAHAFFAALDRQVVTGPTLTNVNDFRAILILPPG